MKKNVLIIGFGDIAKRISHIIKDNEYELYPISRGNHKSDIKNYIKWDWLSKEIPKLDITESVSYTHLTLPTICSV